MKHKPLDQEINDFIDYWDHEALISLLSDLLPLIELYYVEEENDWVKDAVGEEDTRNVRLIRTVYLLSKLADKHAGKLSQMKMKYKDLWRRLEEKSIDVGIMI